MFFQLIFPLHHLLIAVTRSIGNAEKNKLLAFKPWKETPERYNEFQLGIIDNKFRAACKLYPNYQLEYPEQVLICCGIELLSNGKIIKSAIGGWSYDVLDNPKYQICHVNDDIYSAIINYNKNKMTCEQHFQLQEQRETFDYLKHIKDANIAIKLHERHEKNRREDSYTF